MGLFVVMETAVVYGQLELNEPRVRLSVGFSGGCSWRTGVWTDCVI